MSKLEEDLIKKIRKQLSFVEKEKFSDQEIQTYLPQLINIMEVENNCKNTTEWCGATHYFFKRDAEEKLEAISFNCPKFKEYFDKQNFVDGYSEISSSQKKYFLENVKIKNLTPSRKKLMDLLNGMLFENVYKGFYLYSSDRHDDLSNIIVAFTNSVIKKHQKKIIYATTTNLIDVLSEHFWFSNAQKNLKQELKKAEILIIGNLGLERRVEWFHLNFLLDILDYRFKNEKITIFVSNRKLDSLKSYYSSGNELDKINVNILIEKIKKLSFYNHFWFG